MPTATLGRTLRAPAVALRFAPTTRHPSTGQPLVQAVRALPGRRWDEGRSRWVVTAFGPHPTRWLLEAGFDIDLTRKITDPQLADVTDLDELVAPYAELTGAGTEVLIHPRLGGYDYGKPLVPAGASWNKDRGGWLTTALDAAGRTSLVLQDGIREAAHASRAHVTTPDHLREQAANVALSLGTNADPDAMADLIRDIGDVPTWFGLDLYPYQRAGAIGLAAGHFLDADAPGAGKTRTTLAAAAIARARRVLVLCPSKVITAWTREAEASCVHTAGGTRDGLVVPILASRKEPALPEAGVVVCTDSLVTSRGALRARIIDWAPDVLIYDEAHRARNWDSARAVAVREIASRCALPIAATGTPMRSTPADMVSLLAITGHLDPVFGGPTQYLDTYCRKDHFGAWVPRKGMLTALNEELNAHVWVRRLKEEILPDLPPKSRRAQIIDVDLGAFRTAHADVLTKVDEWLDTLGHELDLTVEADLELTEKWARGQIGLMSPLRVAAGLAKVPVAAEYIAEWVHAYTGSDGSCDRPLIVWVHHREVGRAMLTAAKEAAGAGAVGAIGGSTSDAKVRQTVDAFQAGDLPVLVCSLTAAGVGLTLTRGSDSLFVETSYVVDEVTQAEDRQHRVGATRPVVATTLIAPGTLDERIQSVLAAKARTLDQVLVGGDNHAAVITSLDGAELSTPSQIVTSLAAEAVAARRRRRRRSRAA